MKKQYFIKIFHVHRGLFKIIPVKAYSYNNARNIGRRIVRRYKDEYLYAVIAGGDNR